MGGNSSSSIEWTIEDKPKKVEVEYFNDVHGRA
jgi:hypothetical protein